MIQADSVHSTPPTNTSAINPPEPVDMARRHVLTVAAAGAVAVVAGIPASVQAAMSAADPVFELIDLHRKAHATHYAAIDQLTRLEKSGDWDSRWITEQPCHDDNDAFDHLIEAAATTLPGLFAKIDYLLEFAEREAWMLEERQGTATALIESFAVSVAALIGGRP
jgi:hypothetical protein